MERIPLAVDILRRMGAQQIFLFGSAAETPDIAGDIDIAVKGIPINRVLEADVAVHDILKFPVDLVSQEENPAFFEIVKRYGKNIL